MKVLISGPFMLFLENGDYLGVAKLGVLLIIDNCSALLLISLLLPKPKPIPPLGVILLYCAAAISNIVDL